MSLMFETIPVSRGKKPISETNESPHIQSEGGDSASRNSIIEAKSVASEERGDSKKEETEWKELLSRAMERTRAVLVDLGITNTESMREGTKRALKAVTLTGMLAYTPNVDAQGGDGGTVEGVKKWMQSSFTVSSEEVVEGVVKTAFGKGVVSVLGGPGAYVVNELMNIARIQQDKVDIANAYKAFEDALEKGGGTFEHRGDDFRATYSVIPASREEYVDELAYLTQSVKDRKSEFKEEKKSEKEEKEAETNEWTPYKQFMNGHWSWLALKGEEAQRMRTLVEAINSGFFMDDKGKVWKIIEIKKLDPRGFEDFREITKDL